MILQVQMQLYLASSCRETVQFSHLHMSNKQKKSSDASRRKLPKQWHDTLSCLCTVCLCLYICVCVRAGWRAAWQVGGSHLFPALQQLSFRTFLHLVPVPVLAGVCNLYFSSICSTISSFPSVSWTLTDLLEMVIHVMDTAVKATDDFTTLVQQCQFNC